MQIRLGRPVEGLAAALGEFIYGEATSSYGDASPATTGGAQPDSAADFGFPVFYQRLPSEEYYVAFEPGSSTHQILGNDQNRFALPRSLPPILDLVSPREEDNPTGDTLIARYAYTEGAFTLLEELLASGFIFDMDQFLDFSWQLAQALSFLHAHEIVHGQWNPKSIVAIPGSVDDIRIRRSVPYRFEVFNTGVCFQDPDSVPREFVERGYYPAEVFLGSDGAPDYHALDVKSDVYCFSAFLKDVADSAGSTEELPSQAARILEDLEREAHPRGWKTSPEQLRRKELEILDHLYTIKLGIEDMIQEGLKDRETRASAAQIARSAQNLHEKSHAYLAALQEHGFEPVNVFGDQLQHYTAFNLTVSPSRINNHQDSRVVLTGPGLPHDMVRVTLNERQTGVHVLKSEPGRVEFQVSRAFPIGSYKVSINNRRTNGGVCPPVESARAGVGESTLGWISQSPYRYHRGTYPCRCPLFADSPRYRRRV